VSRWRWRRGKRRRWWRPRGSVAAPWGGATGGTRGGPSEGARRERGVRRAWPVGRGRLSFPATWAVARCVRSRRAGEGSVDGWGVDAQPLWGRPLCVAPADTGGRPVGPRRQRPRWRRARACGARSSGRPRARTPPRSRGSRARCEPRCACRQAATRGRHSRAPQPPRPIASRRTSFIVWGEGGGGRQLPAPPTSPP